MRVTRRRAALEESTMHELGIAAEIHRLCGAWRGGSPPRRLARVRVAIGELSAVEPELLRYAWEAITAAGPDRGVALEIDWRRARQVCATCGTDAERAPGAWVLKCPDCGTPLAVEGGRELDLIGLEYAAEAAEVAT
jgi:hydrogenase nickel incorporation protein HypA/HybF